MHIKDTEGKVVRLAAGIGGYERKLMPLRVKEFGKCLH